MESCVMITYALQYLFTADFNSHVELYGNRQDCFRTCYFNETCASVLYNSETEHCVITKDLLSLIPIDPVSGETAGYWYYELRAGGCDWATGWKYYRPSETCFRILPHLTHDQAEAQCAANDASILTGEGKPRAKFVKSFVKDIGEDIWLGAETNGSAWFWTSGGLVDSKEVDLSCEPADCLVRNSKDYCATPCNSMIMAICQKFLN